jgi:ATP-dependent helicase/nuclease subunit A
MKLPAEEIRNVPGNETMALAAELKKQENAFEELCVWYVAMSRAKQALYLFSQEPKKLEPEKCPNFPQLLAAGFNASGTFSSDQSGDARATLGDSLWFKNFQSKAAEPERDPLPLSISVPARAPALEKILPSAAGHELLRGSQAFLESTATALGAEVHSLFESIEWLPEKLVAGSRELGAGLNDASSEARELIKSCLGDLEIQRLFGKPESHFTLWREQRFDLLQDGLWISGCFDRVVIFRDSQGRATGADLIDFKTDQGGREKLIANYRPQLESYRRALSQILHLPEIKIRMILIEVRSDNPVVVLE